MQSLLLGPSIWEINNDSKLCSADETYHQLMTLSACREDEFTCKDGNCVSMNLRCDGRTHCQDGYDEEECRLLIAPVGYNKFLVPPAPGDNEKLTINASITIEKINIDEVDGFLRTKLTLNTIWFDTQLTYQNLKQNEKNFMYAEDMESIWKPWVQFENIENIDKVKKTGQLDSVAIIPNDKFEFKNGGLENIHNTFLFKGSLNALNFERQLTVDWTCQFNLAWYPFDIQICVMMIYINENTVIISPSSLEYKGPKELTQHTVKSVSFCSFLINDKEGLLVEVELGRPIIGSILTVFLPTGMLLFISQMAKSYSETYLDMVIEVNLTVLLVLTTL